MQLLALIFVFIMMSGSAFAIPLDPAKGGSTNKHNLSFNSSNIVKASSDTRICVFCHTPHGASAQSALWNRKDPTMTGFKLYGNGVKTSLNIDDPAIVGSTQYSSADSSAYPNGATRMCLSCHDGVSAIGQVLSESSPIGMTHNTLGGAYSGGVNASGAKVVVDLSTSHPVSFIYKSPASEVITYLNSTAGGGLDGRIDYVLPTIVPLDSAGRMQCTTCHDPHEDTRTATYNLPFWRNYSNGLNETLDYDSTCGDCHKGSDWGGSWGGSPAALPVIIH